MLSPREQQILRVIVNEYRSSAAPVGSQLVWQRYGLGISPATIRNVMAALTQAGYLRQPHTSAGRVPTEQAYRLFVEGAEASAPNAAEREKLSLRIKKAPNATAAANVLTRQLAEVAGAVGVYVDADGVRVYGLANAFGHPEFQDIRVARYLAEVIDQAGEWLPKLAVEPGKVAMRIGEENQDYRARQVSVLASTDGERYYAVIGSTRMPYQKLLSLFEYGQELVRNHG